MLHRSPWSSIDTTVRYQSSSWNATAVLAERTPTYVISGRRRVPNYRKVMKNATNKSAPAEFICVYLTDSAPQILKEHQWLMLAGGFTNGLLVKVVEHTRILLHTIDLATTHSMIIVRCDDTDVLVLLIYYCGKGMFANCKVYMNAGHCSKTTNCQRFIPVNDITSKIGQDVSICLPASHAISDCDTTSSLFKIGKRTAYNTLVVNIADMPSLAELIQSSDVTNGLPTATKYALLLYGVKGRSCQSLNATTMRARSASLFPPTDDALVSTSDASITKWLYGSTVMKQSQISGILMAMDGS